MGRLALALPRLLVHIQSTQNLAPWFLSEISLPQKPPFHLYCRDFTGCIPRLVRASAFE